MKKKKSNPKELNLSNPKSTLLLLSPLRFLRKWPSQWRKWEYLPVIYPWSSASWGERWCLKLQCRVHSQTKKNVSFLFPHLGHAALTLRSRLRCIIVRKNEMGEKSNKPHTSFLVWKILTFIIIVIKKLVKKYETTLTSWWIK